MVSWSNQLFLSKSIKKHDLENIKKSIEDRKFTCSIYCISLASNPKNLFDIYNSKELLFPYYKKKDIHIIGLAKSKKQAFELVLDIIDEIHTNTGDVKFREYFL